MKAIKFNTINFELIGINVSADHLSATIVKDDYAVDDVIEELEDTTTITISEDDETTAVYNGYSKIFAVTYYKNYEYNGEAADAISVELINENIQQQINELFSTVQSVQSEQNSHSETITSLSGELHNHSDVIANLNDEVTSQSDELTNLNDSLTNLNGSLGTITDKVNKKLDASVIGEVETIGDKSLESYEVNDTFMGSDGKYYKATAPIIAGTILSVGGNCEETNVSDELKSE